MKDLSLQYWIMEKHTESEKDTQTLSSASGRKTRTGKECAASPATMKLGTVIPYLNTIQKIYESCDTPLDFC